MPNIISFIFLAIALIIAITIHEFAHALVADRLGDPTPRSQGRLTLNPLKHLDPIGTLLLIFVHFGWGKPVQIDPYNFRNPKRDELLVSLAGPASNIILAIILSLIIHFIPTNYLTISLIANIIQFNIVLAIFNLIPVPPLDGSKILLNSLPTHIASQWEDPLNRYGPIILIALVFLPLPGGSNMVSLIITPILNLIFGVLIP